LSDSSDEEYDEVNEKSDSKKSFDDLFGESKVTPNKSKNDESDDEAKDLANIDDLMGGSDDEDNSKDDDWDLENV